MAATGQCGPHARHPLRSQVAAAVMRTVHVRPKERAPVFVAICWEQVNEDGEAVTVTADLCRDHRAKIALKYPSARGCGRLGDSCAFCEG